MGPRLIGMMGQQKSKVIREKTLLIALAPAMATTTSSHPGLIVHVMYDKPSFLFF